MLTKGLHYKGFKEGVMRKPYVFEVDDGTDKWEEKTDAVSKWNAAEIVGLRLAHKGIKASTMKYLYSKKTERGHHGRDKSKKQSA